MADTKVSDLTTATTVGGGDLLYLVQNNTSKKVTTSTLFGNAANVSLKGNITLDTNVQVLSTSGAIDTTKQITHLVAGAGSGTLTLAPGDPSQLKIVVMLSTAGGTFTMRGNIVNNANVVFSAAGNTSTLLFTNNTWFVIGGTARIT